jgi:signal transduction histidine kinase
MRVSLVTRIVAGYLLVLLMLGSLAIYSVNTMSEMRQDVAVVKEGLLPTSGRFQRFSRELSRLAAALSRGTLRQVTWASQNLAEIRVFDTLSDLRSSVEALSASPRLPERTRLSFQSVAVRLERLTESDSLFALVQRRGTPLPPTALPTNRALFDALYEPFSRAVAGAQEELPPRAPAGGDDDALATAHVRAAAAPLQVLLRGVLKELSGVEAAYNLAVNTAWGDTASREGTTVTAAVVLGLVSLAVIIAVFFLFLAWLRPLRALKAFANRVSRGEYGQGVPIRSRDEIGELASELSTMASRLKEREEMIRSQARELLRSDRFSTIGKMATQIAHEIRNPLNAMGLKLELLEEAVDQAKRSLAPQESASLSEGVASISREIDRLREITDYYLKFAKFPSVEKEHVDLSAVLADLVGFYEDEARLKGVRLEKDLERGLKAHVDPNLLRHAMTNLLKNAMEALAAGPSPDAQITVKAWREKDQVRILVKDNGPGIPGDVQPHVFDPFFSTKKSGTGLGLTLVQQVVAEHGGDIACTSAPGEGTVFRISLP